MISHRLTGSVQADGPNSCVAMTKELDSASNLYVGLEDVDCAEEHPFVCTSYCIGDYRRKHLGFF